MLKGSLGPSNIVGTFKRSVLEIKTVKGDTTFCKIANFKDMTNS